MRPYYIASGILLILSIIDFAVAAPVGIPVQEKLQVGVDVLRLPEDATTMLGKRGDDLRDLFGILRGHFGNLEDLVINPGPPRGPLGPADWPTDVKKPPPSTPEEPSVPSPPPSPASSTESGNKLAAPPGPSGPAKSTMSRLG